MKKLKLLRKTHKRIGLFLKFKVYLTLCISLLFVYGGKAQILPGAYRTGEYFPVLKNKNIALVANHTSLIGITHLADSLLNSGLRLKKIFCPEHGFRGTADAGELIHSSTDVKTGLQVVSVYGKSKKPTPAQIAGIDIVVFDLQDVGVRCYTYLSTLHYIMEACAENNVQLIVLDRPNPNVSYVDGPVLRAKFRSFVGMHPVPVVYGMTIGEYAQMINGEGWLNKNLKCRLTVIPCSDYSRLSKYILPVNPSPNLPNQCSVYLYPSLCFFEGTCVSVGRGTEFPFQVLGHPGLSSSLFSFTPEPKPGAKNPLYENQICFGYDLRSSCDSTFTLKYIMEMYSLFPEKDAFFNPFFNKLAGNDELIFQVKSGKTEEEIRATWKPELEIFLKIRQKYLIYK